MGVAGLWDVIRPAGKTRSLTELSVTEGFEANPDDVRGYRIGIDASIWFFHAEYGKEGENPVLRTLFFRCATLMHSPFLPLFVFDGPKRPEWKRGKKINRTSNKLIPGMKAIVESFGFEWRMAPGEAEAELAYLNRIGIIDGILSDDVDNFLFGATTVIRNASNNLSGNRSNPVLNAAGKDDKNHTKVYRMSDISVHPDIRLTRGGMILIGLMSGGDYHQGGLNRCGTITAHGLAKCGFGDTLYQAASNMTRDELKTFLIAWRHELCHELRTNAQGYIGRKQPSLANAVPSDFPDIDVLLSYTNPITSESMGRAENNLKLTWSKEPDLGKLAATCEFYFEWGYKEAIIKRFRTVIWHSAVLRILRRAVLNLDAKSVGGALPPATPRKAGKPPREPIGTPSKMIAKHFSSLNLGGPSDSEDDDDERLIVKIHSERKHVSTDEILEYRLEIAPAQFVRIAESGIKGTRSPEGPDEWADDDDEDGDGKGGKKPPPDPESHIRVWMPACMVRLVEPRLVEEFEAVQEKKRSKKTRKARGKTETKAVVTDDDGSELDDPPVAKPKKKVISTQTAKTTTDDDGSELDDLPVLKPKRTIFKEKAKTTSEVVPEDKTEAVELPPSQIIRDLTNKKTVGSSTTDLKSFFATAKPLTSAKVKASSALPSVLSKVDTFHRASAVVLRAATETEKPDTVIAQASKAPVVRDLTRKKAKPVQELSHSTPLDSFLGSVKSKNIQLNAIASSSKTKQCVDVSSDEDSDTSRPLTTMLVSPKKPNRLAVWNKAPVSSYVAVSDSDDDAWPRLGLDDSHMYESDDPFDVAPRCSPPKLKQTRKKQAGATSSSSSDVATDDRRLHKSPRKSKELSSPRKNHASMKKPERPCSPSNRRAHPLVVVEISDSDDELPPAPRFQDPPLLLARSRAGAKIDDKQTFLDKFVRPLEKKRLATDTYLQQVIIDLT
ncbi:hypothetical protein C0991_008958 [Blastosporella zonata]|nr:hypothetical protein C0991_008958 [Blastosporella zonata]